MARAKDVFAHFMVQNSYSYSQAEWETEISKAKETGIDGFALNWIPPYCQSPNLSWQMDRIADAFAAAEELGFKLFHSFDMAYYPGGPGCSGTGWTAELIADQLNTNKDSSAMYKWNGAILVSTYAGTNYGNDLFRGVKDQARSRGFEVSIAPALTDFAQDAQRIAPDQCARNLINQFPEIDGFFNWQAWPLDVPSNLTAQADVEFKEALKSTGRTGPYIMAVAPWQFKDLGGDSWVQNSDTLFKYRWEDAIDTVNPDIIEILTWNDYAESSYIADLPPKSEDGPGSVQLFDQGNYVYGMSHAAWRTMTSYYIQWYKTGSRPTVTSDHAVLWYRPYPKSAQSSSGNGSSSVRNSAGPQDAVFIWALVSKPSTISTSVGANYGILFDVHEASVPTMYRVDFPRDFVVDIHPMTAVLRDGTTVQAADGKTPITKNPTWTNMNAAVVGAGPLVLTFGSSSGTRRAIPWTA
ncbi:glycoside hydrolase [Eremomyces bilateralis CBS 781.70]|uniref:Glycoside hydrolase n=1 Tax=Eremomyces bilateralis CBS 781.70 TaxID=1392243 RepID=A0A6G1FSD8_9PEZI|nr:glycoside hydrolase [Eremomyces bilateralis CBS 781.70]KAF1808599.1 glycoside hydrolase [Eremomyces bilateralis CBS 781.70]